MKKKILEVFISLLAVIAILVIGISCQQSEPEEAAALIPLTTSFNMMSVTSAVYTMGYASIATPTHTATLSINFSIGETEVTYGLWYEVLHWAIANGYSFTRPGREGKDGVLGAYPTSAQNEPVTTVTWYDVVKWCNALSEKQGYNPIYYNEPGFSTVYKTGNVDASADWTKDGYRLPTEAEWELAARSDNGGGVRNGDEWSGDSTVDTVAWYLDNSSLNTHDVKGKTANEEGIYDMTGNVWEWVWDWKGTYTTASPYTDANTRGPSAGTRRVYRGGGWGFSASNCMVSRRYDGSPSNGGDFLGFRIVRVP